MEPRNFKFYTLGDDEFAVSQDSAILALRKLNDIQPQIQFTYAGLKRVRYSAEGHLDSLDLNASIADLCKHPDLSICLCSIPLNNNYYATYGNCGVITLAYYPTFEAAKIPQDTYVAFFTAKALAVWYFPVLRTIEHELTCPIRDYPPRQEGSRINISSPELCRKCHEAINPEIALHKKDIEIKNALDEMFSHIANEVRAYGVIDGIKFVSVTSDIPMEWSSGARPDTPQDALKTDGATAESGIASAIAETKAKVTIITPLIPIERGAVADRADDVHDSLNYSVYIRALAGLIGNPETQTPLTIALCAPWGRGKSFIALKIFQHIRSDKNLHAVWFNAWEHSKAGNVWVHLYASILESLRVNRNIFRKFIFQLSLLWRKLRAKWHVIVGVLTISVLGMLILLLLGPVLSPFHSSVFNDLLTLIDNLSEEIITSIAGVSLLTMITWLWKNLQPASKRFLRSAGMAISSDNVVTQEQVFKNIEFLRDWQNKKNKDERIVCFVDDIDRCPPDEIIGVLEAVKLFLSFDNIIFVLAMDAGVICPAVGTRYAFVPNTTHADIGREYLDKIIQIPFHIPMPNKETFLQYAEKLFNPLLADKASEAGKPMRDAQQETPMKESIHVGEGQPKEESAIAQALTDSGGQATAKDERELQIKEWEWVLIKQILAQPGICLSPRLTKRFVNMYHLSRNLILQYGLLPSEGLMKSYIGWLVLSIQYPEETRSLDKWFSCQGWKEIRQTLPPWLETDTQEGKKIYSVIEIKLMENEHLLSVDPSRFSRLIDLFVNRLDIRAKYLEKTRHIYSCFHLIFD